MIVNVRHNDSVCVEIFLAAVEADLPTVIGDESDRRDKCVSKHEELRRNDPGFLS